MTFTQWLHKAFGPWMQNSRASRRRKSRQPLRHRCVPRLEVLEDRTLLSGTTGAPDSFLLTPVPDSSPIAMHIHPHLSILINGQNQVIPADIGVEASGDLPMHTHDDSGTIHIESPVAQDFTLQDFFTVWGQSFSSQNFLGHPVDAADPLVVTDNGQVVSDPGSLVLHDQDNIVIQYGSAPTAAIQTDQTTYLPGSTINITGSGFTAGETVDLQIDHIDGTVNPASSPVQVVADAAGAISASFFTTAPAPGTPDAEFRYELTATGETSHQSAFTTFKTEQATSGTATVTTDRYDYQPGATAVISGSGFTPGETVAVQVLHIDGVPNTDASHNPWTVTADAAGNFQTTWTVDTVDALDSKLEVSAVGAASHNQADTTFTDSSVQRPFWIFGHNPNSDAITNQYLSMGVNALEPDVEYFSSNASDPISKGFYIAHQAGGLPLSNYSDPTLSLHDYLDHLSQHLSGFIDQNGNFVHTNNTQLSLVELDVKTEAANAPDALKYIISTINTEILPDHPELYFLINVGTISDANSLFTMSADDALKDIPAASKSHFGFSIDGENDPVAVQTTLRNKLGADANIAYGDGTSGCCGVYGDTQVVEGVLGGTLSLGVIEADPEIALVSAIAFVAGQFIYAGPNVGPSLQQAVEMRAANGGFNMIAYGFSITGTDSMKMLIDSGVDGMIPADSLDITSPFSQHGFSLNVGGTNIGTQSYGDTQDALNLVKGGYGGTFMATTADDPFAIHGATIDAQGNETVTGTRDGYDLEVKTSDVLGAGTDAHLTFTLHGSKGSASVTIDSNFPNEMERNDTNYVFIPSGDLGTLQSVTVFNAGDGGLLAPLNHEWNLDYINVRSEAYLGKDNFLHADFGGVDVDNPFCLDFGLLGQLCFDTGDQNPSTRGFSNYLTGTSQATATGGLEGETAATLSDATFHDSITTTTDFSITAANWGDGSTDTTGLTISPIAGSPGNFTVNGSHLYTEDGNFGFSITVKAGGTGLDKDNTAIIHGEVHVDDPPVVLTSATFHATEGALSPVETLATFTDPGGAEKLTDYKAEVDWGDGNFVTDPTVSISGPDTNGVFTVTGQHLFTDEDAPPGPVQVRIIHEPGRTTEDGTPDEEVSVISVPLALTDPPVNATAATGPFLATEGTMSARQTLATFTDPGGLPENLPEYSVDVDWGNGTFVLSDPNVSISGPDKNGVFTVTGQHLYTDEDGFTGPVRVRINHEASTPSPVVSLPLTLTDPPLVAAGTSLAAVRGACPNLAVATFTDPGGAEPNDDPLTPALSNDYSAKINWGDGTPDDDGLFTYTSSTNTFTVSNHHDYTTNGTFTITVTLHHEQAVPDVTVTSTVKVVSVLNHSQGLGDPNALVIGAALSGSSILVVPVGKQTGALTDAVQVLIDGVPQINTDTGGTTFTGFNSINIYGQAGNDNLEVSGSIKKNVAFFGGGGNDRMKGDAGTDIFVGGKGNDTIIGGTGRDIMIGGGGNDRLVAGPGGDILIAGSTDFDDPCDPVSNAMLLAIEAAWTNPTALFNDRAKAVLALFSTDGSNAAHVHYDSVTTTKLTGIPGQDMFFEPNVDPITGKPRGK